MYQSKYKLRAKLVIMDCSLHDIGGQLCVLRVEAAGGLEPTIINFVSKFRLERSF